MKSILILAMMAIIVFAAAYIVARFCPSPFQAGGLTRAINSAGTHETAVSRIAEGAIASPYLLVKAGTNPFTQVITCGAAEEPVGVAQDDATDTQRLGVDLLNGGRTLLMVASEAITAGDDIYTAASGKVQDEPGSAGTYWKVGKAVAAAAADGDAVEVATHTPIKVVVIAALTSTNGTAAAASASLANLAAEAEKIGDDVRAIGAALATPALVKVLSA